MVPYEQLLPHSARKPSSVSRFIFQRPVFWGRCWRAGWLAVGLIFAFQNLRAELVLAHYFDQKPHSAREYRWAAQQVLRIFPYDRHLKTTARNMLSRLGRMGE